MRPSWDQYFLGMAQSASKRGDCRRSKVGAVLVDRNKVVVSTGFNGVPSGDPGCLEGACPRGKASYEEIPAGSDYSNCIATHAEYNALEAAFNAGQIKRFVGGTMYISREPCWECQAVMFLSGVTRAVWEGGECNFNNEREREKLYAVRQFLKSELGS